MAKKILVADDEFNIVKLIASRLMANNYEVVTASDGMQTVAKAHKEKPDLIILDIKMPAGGGVTVYDNLKTSLDTTFIPVIFITAHPSEETRKEVLQKGAVDFIPKPFNADDLLAAVRKVLGNER